MRDASSTSPPRDVTCSPSAAAPVLLMKRYNSCRVLAFSTIFFHLAFSTIFFHSRRSWASSDHLVIFIFLKSFLTSSSHLFFRSSHWSSCKRLPFIYFLYNTGFRLDRSWDIRMYLRRGRDLRYSGTLRSVDL